MAQEAEKNLDAEAKRMEVIDKTTEAGELREDAAEAQSDAQAYLNQIPGLQAHVATV